MNDITTSPIPVFNWFEKPIKESVYSVFHDLKTGTEALDLFKKYRKHHFNSLKSRLESMKILGMSQPVPLVEIYSPSSVSTTIHRRLYEKNWYNLGKHPYDFPAIKDKMTSKYVRADEYVESHKRAVILGSPGSGKTTFLRFLGLAYSDKKVFESTNLKTSLFPIFISMLAFTQRSDQKSSLLDYIIEDLIKKTDKYAEYFIKRIFEKGLSIILLDGLDEIPLLDRTKVFPQIQNLCDTYPNCKVIISSRTADYTGGFESFYEVELAKLSPQAVNKIVKAWFPNKPSKAKQLIQHIKRDKDLQALVETPLLLSLLCIQFRHDLALPKRKTELYKRCIDAFLRDWDACRDFRRDTAYATLSDERKERIFEHIAGKYFVEQRCYNFPEADLCEQIGLCCERFGMSKKEGSNVLKEIERHHGILERFSADSYMFSHPSFQEYFAALYLLSKRTEFDAVKNNFDDSQWETTIEFIVSMQVDPSSILKFLVKQSNMSKTKTYPAMARRTSRLWLLYRCMSTCPAIDPSLRTEIYEHLVDSQIEMSRIYEGGGVFPIAVLGKDGVRHSYLYSHRRPTLYEALQPLRLLGNEILLSPSEDYANAVLDRLDRLSSQKSSMPEISYLSLVLSLSIPIAPVVPDKILRWLKAAKSPTMDYFEKLAIESMESLSSYSKT